jgi:hypothetical protein
MSDITRVSAYEHDIFIPQVFGNGQFTGTWNFDAFHDIRDKLPTRARGFSGMLDRCFNTFNGDLVVHARMGVVYGVIEPLDGISFEVDHHDLAIEYCRRLREYGRWAYAYQTGPKAGTPAEQRAAAEQRLTVRLVRSRKASIIEEYPS